MSHFDQQLRGKAKPQISNIYQTDNYDKNVKKQYSVDPFSQRLAQNKFKNQIFNNNQQWNPQDHIDSSNKNQYKQLVEKLNKKQESLLEVNGKLRQNENAHYPQSAICQTRNMSTNSKFNIQEVKYEPLIPSNQIELKFQLNQNELQSPITNLRPERYEKFEKLNGKSVRSARQDKPPQKPMPQERYPVRQETPQTPISIPVIQENVNSMEIDMYQSLTRSVVIQCFHCDMSQNRDFIFLPCGHQFHAECLKFNLENQVNQQQAMMRCKCGKNIPQNIIKLYLSQFQLKIYYQIQVQYLPIHNQGRYLWKKCSNLGCDYIYIQKSSQGSFQSRCPNCLEDIRGQSIIFDKQK